MPPKKTNAARLLDDLGISYELREAQVDESDLSATTMARLLGVSPDEVYKTLVARGDKHGVLMACIPAEAELDLKKLAAASGNKNVSMVPLKEVFPLTGYIRGGCSPLGAKKPIPSTWTKAPFCMTVFSSAPGTGAYSFISLQTICFGQQSSLCRHHTRLTGPRLSATPDGTIFEEIT